MELKMKTRILSAIVLSILSSAALAGGNVDNGKNLVTQKGCVACHGADMTTPLDPTYPKLAGQHADYIEHALTAYQRGVDGPNGRGNAIMGGQAKLLSKQEVQDIAAYLGSLPGHLVTAK
jgi:cytochrome c553